MTAAQRKTLKLVKDGKCQRQYTASGNKMHGAHAATLWTCLRNGWIRDGKQIGNWCTLELTEEGRASLNASNP